MSVTLRDYQSVSLDRIRGRMREGRRKILVVAPTGAGKTTIAAAVIDGAERKGKRVIFLAHRKELIEQCSARLDDLDVQHGIIKADHPRTNPEHPVQVASIQTLVRRDHCPADIIIVDEAHRSTSKTYSDIIERYDDPAILGLTATPYRMDGKGLGELYDEMEVVAEAQELIDRGFLINPTIYGSEKLDLSKVSVQAGDYHKGEIAEAMMRTILHGELLKNWTLHCGRATGTEIASEIDACTVCFAPNVEHSKLIVEQFKEAGVRAAHIDAHTPDKERDRILKALRQRDITMVSNVGLLTEGWDLPHLECVILDRPTRSKGFYKQMVGRIMRPDDEKKFAFVLDHANCTRTHGFVNEPQKYSLKGREERPRRGGAEAPFKECKECHSLCPIGAERCEACGFLFPRREISYTDEELIELRPENIGPRPEKVPNNKRQEAFKEFAVRCVELGHKPNWARVRYNQRFGHWPSAQTGISMPRFFYLYERNYKATVAAKAG